ncbi:MAG TPA: metal ABC transporter ATP-binding protein [Anaerolineaceae bacterium]
MKNSDLIDSPARLELDKVTIAYNSHPALEDISLKIPHGARVAVVGPNGAGKSTLFKALVGLLPLSQGQILIHGETLGTHQDCVAYIPQREDVDWRFPVTVEDVVMMGRFGKFGWFRRATARDHQIVRHSMDQMGILSLAQRSIGELSGGQQQRAFLARALAQEPHILLMDEPFTGVDVTTQEVTLNLLEQLRQQKVTVLVSTHDLNMAAQRFDTVILLNHRLIAFGPPQEVFTQQNVSAAFKSQVMFIDTAMIVDQCCAGDEEKQAAP